MSRGLGRVQREILKVTEDGRVRTIRTLAMEVYEDKRPGRFVFQVPPSRSQEIAVRRAVHGLAAQGLVQVSETSMAGFKVNGQIMGKMLVHRPRPVSVISHDFDDVTPADITAKLAAMLATARTPAVSDGTGNGCAGRT